MKFLGLAFLVAAYHFVQSTIDDNPYEEILPITYLYKSNAKPIMCIKSCRGMPDGDYHSCKGCFYFATCTNGYLVDARKCAWFGGLLWDDIVKRCEWSSSTCSRVVYKPPNYATCVKDCFRMPNGDYQSCHGCRVFVTCSNGLTYDKRPCPWFLLWDDLSKRCLWRSRTCIEPLLL
ncbi:uncharacterized protein LOC123561673 [Mercenaria mercenaria]|uniref:uncharacterized protein LOC123561673 n=1 Tax=Mercenaria mercenaria TaxID=6596 RepID=UPI00234F9881|nr:uncharacterized protein LOC123561673 [Mercenaria mercenaria]XP_045210124.2 uncharacterized protein LOC123561673 [Mercenaria mercenaria]XP_045210127.2 uncharacterized protein LOC123561673 [Mercenaria mercenaria]XP_045210128.2 uncharacterized protein LOC123561673 [Mercenaria mercenaria]